MKGAIVGDIIGSRFEFAKMPKDKNFELFVGNKNCFTDDTIHTCATAYGIINWPVVNPVDAYVIFSKNYINCGACGFGRRFLNWLESDIHEPYGSFGNGSAMRISPVGWYAQSEDEVKKWSRKFTEVTHNHPEGIKGAECIAMGIYLLRNLERFGLSKNYILERLAKDYDYDLSITVEDIRLRNSRTGGNEICQLSVPEALVCFKEGNNFEECVRNAVYCGGDTDTIAAITGSLAEAYYGIPDKIWETAKEYLTYDLAKIVEEFEIKFIKSDIL